MEPKFEAEITQFQEKFRDFREKKLILYGTGRMTMTLLNGNAGFQIVGLCDRDVDRVGTTISGVPVVDQAKAEEQGDLLVINTSATYWNAIYQRIKHWNIPIYFRDGTLAHEAQEPDYSALGQWDGSIEDLSAQIQAHEIVSFDIYDTLLMRKVLFPADVFQILQENIPYHHRQTFLTLRKEAPSHLSHPNIHQIYDWIAASGHLPLELVQDWKERELALEEALLLPRRDMVALCQRCMEDKQVYFISDMYLPREWMQKQLYTMGIEAELEQILVSCDLGRSKEDGSLWFHYQAHTVRGRSALHIGDNEDSDVQQPRNYGIDSYHIMNPTLQLQCSPLGGILSSVKTIPASLGMGLLVGELMNSPFAWNATQGRIVLSSNRQAGYCILGPLMEGFCRWLLNCAEQDGIKQLLFFARESYFMMPLFQHWKDLEEKNAMTEDIELQISRRAIWAASVCKEEDVFYAASFPYQGTLSGFLEDRFGVCTPVAEEIPMEQLQKDASVLNAALEPYLSLILCRCKYERENYIRYLSTLGLGTQLGVVDSQYYGTTQFYLSKVMGQFLSGYYLCACTEATNPHLSLGRMQGCFSSGKEALSSVRKQAQFLESYFTASRGMLEYINEDGRPVYAPPMKNQEYIFVREEMQQGILDYMDAIHNLFAECGIDQRCYDPEWADAIFGLMLGPQVSVTEDMKQGFYFDNRALNHREMPIWG